MKLAKLQSKVDSWINTIGVRYFDPKTNMLLLVEEVGELSRLVARVHGEQTFKRKTNDAEINEALQDEMADILFVLACLANQHDIDLTLAFDKNLEKKTRRDKERHQHNPKLSS